MREQYCTLFDFTLVFVLSVSVVIQVSKN